MTSELSLDDFPTLKLKHVYIQDSNRVLQTINRILQDGCKCLQVVTDFDLTLTKQHVNGKQALSSFGIFNKCKQLPETYRTESLRLYHKYRPIEIDPHLSIETKTKEMTNWMAGTQNILTGVPFDLSEIQEVSRLYGTDIRDGTDTFFRQLCDANVPILVFSAGLGDVVEAVLRNQEVLFDNVQIISNFLKYENGKLAGFKNEIPIHVFNKSEHAIGQDYFKILEGRKNVLLMGDLIGDALMVDGTMDMCAVLKIGFLYGNVENALPSYMECFDIVLVDDQTMNVPMDVLRRIF